MSNDQTSDSTFMGKDDLDRNADFAEYRRLILSDIRSLKDDNTRIFMALEEIKIEQARSQTQARMAGAVSGSLSGILGAVVTGVIVWFITKH